MLAAGVLIYGFLTSFILSAGARNRREGQANPFMLTATGLVLCGLTAGAAVILPVWAAVDPAAVPTLTSLS